MVDVDTIPLIPQLERGFSGSYEQGDVTFLLTPVPVKTMTVDEKERYIQRGGGHYSSVLSPEAAPSASYVRLFEEQTERLAVRVARDICVLAQHADARVSTGEVVIVSLARAGTPVGVLVGRTLRRLGRSCTHYCVSIFRDKGLDTNALSYILSRHKAPAVVFVDGWTGKGVVSRALAKSVADYNQKNNTQVNPSLAVLADIAGTAGFSATRSDYLLPSAILNATVSGLVSRTVLNPYVGPKDFHGCALLHHLAPHDKSRYFVDSVWSQVVRLLDGEIAHRASVDAEVNPQELNAAIGRYMAMQSIRDINLIKPGVGEATRVLLRRTPRLLVLKDPSDTDVRHLLQLAKEKNVPVTTDVGLPCRALAVIATPD